MSAPAPPSAPARRPAVPADLAPGTNPRGRLSRADWRFLLPRLRHDAVLFLGVPAEPVLELFAEAARDVTVLSADRGRLEEAAAACRARGLDNVCRQAVDGDDPLPLPDGAFSLVAACGGRDSAALLRASRAAEEVARVLAPGGVAYLETRGHAWAWRGTELARRLEAAGLAPPVRFRLMRRGGGIRLAAPVEDGDAWRYLFERVLYGVSRRARLAQRAGALAARLGLLRRLLPDRALVTRRGGGVDADAPAGPAYLSALAARAGLDPAGVRPVFFARGRYDSNKVVFFLFPAGGGPPPALVKVTRSPRYNGRLETEHGALAAVAAHGWAEPGTYPEALFLDHHDGLAAVGERVVEGAPFRLRSRGAPDCPYAAAAVEWITRLGERSARPAAPVRTEGPRLADLLPPLADHYPLTDAELAFLAARLEAADAAAAPRVLQHGDAGTWNVQATGAGRVAFLDWEAARHDGLPLWDLFDFVRSFGAWAVRARGGAGGAEAYRAGCLDETPLARLQAAAVARYRGRVGVDRAAVEPLFYACWASRAVREAAWSSGPPEEGAYFGLLRLCIRERAARGLRWISG